MSEKQKDGLVEQGKKHFANRLCTLLSQFWPLRERDYNKNPLLTIWAKGYAAGCLGEPNEPPYVNHGGGSGGTWGTHANRTWQCGWRVGMDEMRWQTDGTITGGPR